jgi:hypothetical protein
MNIQPDVLPDHLLRLVKAKVPAIDIMHGELKNSMLLAEADYLNLPKDTLEYKYAEGFLDALVACYGLTYDVGHAVYMEEKK